MMRDTVVCNIAVRDSRVARTPRLLADAVWRRRTLVTCHVAAVAIRTVNLFGALGFIWFAGAMIKEIAALTSF